MRKTLTDPAHRTRDVANTAEWRDADIGAANGHGNARSLARMLSAGRRLRRHRRWRASCCRPRDRRPDLRTSSPTDPTWCWACPLRFGIGYGLPEAGGRSRTSPTGEVCFWGGWGGSMVLMNPDRRTTVAYVMNKMGLGTLGNERTARYASLIYEAIS